MKKFYFVISLLLSLNSLFSQCMLRPVDLQSRVSGSSLIIQGKVISSKSFWNNAHNNIFTTHLVSVSQVLKGSLASSFIEVMTRGGVVDLDMQKVEPQLELSADQEGIFMVNTFDQPSQYGYPAYQCNADQQGFIRFEIAENKAYEPFKIYSSINGELKSLLEAELNKTLPAFTNSGSGKNSPAVIAMVPSITSFAPSTITAGTASQLTITGTGFSVPQGTSVVRFQDADNGGGANWITPHATQYISWSATQIVVQVPTRTSGSGSAGTGQIQVVSAGTVTSVQSLTVTHGQLNTLFSNTVIPQQIFNSRHHGSNGSGGMTWRMNTSFATNAPAVADFQNAFGVWRCTTFINWQIGPTVATSTVNQDGINVIGFDNVVLPQLPGGVLGVCSTWFGGCVSGTNIAWYVKELDITYDDAAPWHYGAITPFVGQYDFKSVTLHELGHGHQLAHVIDNVGVMHWSITSNQTKFTLNANDIAGGNAVMARNLSGAVCGQTIMVALSGTNCALAAPTASFNVSSTVCVGQTVPLNDISSNNPNVWSWTMPGGTPGSSTLQNTSTSYSTAGVKSITLVATNGTGSNSIVKSLTVVATPTLSVTSGSMCSGGSKSLTATGTATSYVWNPGGLTGTVQTFSPPNTQVYTVVGSIGSCTASATGTITVTPTPTPNVNSATVCTGQSAILSAGGAGTFTWQPGGGTGPNQTYTPVATQVYTLTGANGTCTTNITCTVVVTSTLNIGVTASSNTICTGDSPTLTANGATNYTFNPGGINSNPAVVSPTLTTTYTVDGTTAGCSGNSVITVTVVNCGVGLNQNGNTNSFLVYPNPTQGLITVNFSSSYTGKITVYNSLGQLLMTKNLNAIETLPINLSDYAKGIYIVKITSDKNINGFIKVVRD